MACTKKPQKIIAISSAITSVNDKNTKFRVTLASPLMLDTTTPWAMSCVQSIIPAREEVQFAKQLWFKRISSPFGSESDAFKNQFNVDTDFAHKYNYLFNMGIDRKDWFGDQVFIPEINLNPSEALTWPNTGNWDLAKVDAFLNSKLFMKFDFTTWKDGLGVWPQESLYTSNRRKERTISISASKEWK